MIRRGRILIIKSIYILIDILCLALSIWAACWLRQSTLPFEVTPHTVFFGSANAFRFVFLSWILTAVLLNKTYGLYQTKREIFETIEVLEVIKAVIIATLITIVGIYILKVEDFPRSILFLGTALMGMSLSLWRICKRFFVEYIVSHGYNNFNVLIVGAGKVGAALASEIDKRPGLGLKIVGYLDDFKIQYMDSKGRKTVGRIADFVKTAKKEFIDKIFITIHHDSKVFFQLLEDAKALGIAVRVVPQGFELMSGEVSKYNLGVIPILEYSEGQNYRKQAGKRIFDFLIAGMITFVLCPVFAVIAMIIKWESVGPVFYLSKRYGRGGRIFYMYKFRSMVQNADQILHQIRHKNEVDGPIFKIKEDPRITQTGKFLRKYSLDELPQLLNVLKGEMSLVGPRPLPIDQIEKEDLRQLQRLEVRPGITGLWQIRGRSDISFSRLVKWDIWYIDNWSFWLDLNILLQTVPVVLKGKGAY